MDIEIPVFFSGSQKWITGLSRSTTCDDVIYALLRHNHGPNDSIDVSEYRMYEEWKDFSRALSGRTRIVKLFRMLGSKARSVRLAIRYAPTMDILDTGSEMSYNSRTRRARRMAKNNQRHSPQNFTKAEVYQYYRRERSRNSPDVHGYSPELHDSSPVNTPAQQDNVEHQYSYTAMVTSQQEELEQLMARNAMMDAQIAHYEAAYRYSPDIVDTSQEQFSYEDSIFPTLKTRDIESYLKMIEGIVSIHEKIEQTHSKACYLASILTEEQHAQALAMGIPRELSEQIAKDTCRIRNGLDECQELTLAQQSELELLGHSLQQCDMHMLEKQQEIMYLTMQLENDDSVDTNAVTHLPHERVSYTPSPVNDHTNTSSPLPVQKYSSKATPSPLPRRQPPIGGNADSSSDKQYKSSDRNIMTNGNSGVYRVSGSHTKMIPDINLDFDPPSNQCQPARFVEDSPDYRGGFVSQQPNESAQKSKPSSPKTDPDRIKGVRFNNSVTEWMYDVLSEDESHFEGNNIQSPNDKQQQQQQHQQETARHGQTSPTGNNNHSAVPNGSFNNKPVSPVSIGGGGRDRELNNKLSSSMRNQYSPTAISAMISQHNKKNGVNNDVKIPSYPPRPQKSPSPTMLPEFTNIVSSCNSSSDAFILPYMTQLKGGSYLNNGDDSNSDTGLSSMNSEEDAMLPLETLV